MTEPTAFERVRDELGLAICDGSLPPGAVVTVDQLEQRSGASRSVVREAVRVLAAMGLVRATQRVGVRVLDDSHWDQLDALVVRWRLASPQRGRQVAELAEVRSAIEPHAAALAALRRTDDQGAQLVAAAEALRTASTDGGHGFGPADEHFHRLLLDLSGNRAFVRLGDLVAEALRDRAEVARAALPPDPVDVDLHARVAAAVAAGAGVDARSAMAELIARGDRGRPG